MSVKLSVRARCELKGSCERVGAELEASHKRADNEPEMAHK